MWVPQSAAMTDPVDLFEEDVLYDIQTEGGRLEQTDSDAEELNAQRSDSEDDMDKDKTGLDISGRLAIGCRASA